MKSSPGVDLLLATPIEPVEQALAYPALLQAGGRFDARIIK